jgi:hypothetical protein
MESFMNRDQQLLDKLIDLAERQARLVLLELKLGSLMAAWVLMSKSGKLEIVATPWRDEPEKRLYAQMLRAMMRQKHIVAYSFVTEAWTRRLESGEWDDDRGQPVDGIETRNYAGREEVVIACACSKDVARWKQWRIVREATTEVIVDLQEQPLPESESPPESWMTDLLKK